jgi:hypothetical protein
MKQITWLLLFAIIFGGIAWRVHYRRHRRLQPDATRPDKTRCSCKFNSTRLDMTGRDMTRQDSTRQDLFINPI